MRTATTAGPADPGHGRELLGAARAGDERAYRRLVEPHRPGLHAHCYRMLGSVHDADDALQETLLRAWRGLGGFAGRSSLRTWLFTIATNVCLTHIDRAARRALPVDVTPAADPRDSDWTMAESAWLEPYPDDDLGPETGFAGPAARYERRESVELAFVAAVQHLGPGQRAVLLLRDVLGFSAREVAAALGTTTAAANSMLQRARQAVRTRLPERSQQASLRALGDERLQALVEAYVDAWERGDAAAILAMLVDDVTFSMPPFPVWYRGLDAVAAFLPRGPLTERWRLIPITANGQLAFGCYRWVPQADAYLADSIDVVSVRGDRIEQITGFLGGEALPRFGLPDALAAGAVLVA